MFVPLLVLSYGECVESFGGIVVGDGVSVALGYGGDNGESETCGALALVGLIETAENTLAIEGCGITRIGNRQPLVIYSDLNPTLRAVVYEGIFHKVSDGNIHQCAVGGKLPLSALLHLDSYSASRINFLQLLQLASYELANIYLLGGGELVVVYLGK